MQSPLLYLSPKDIVASGFYRELLLAQKNGLTGHIGTYFPDLSDQSAWLGGQGESWERGPYYIDGLIPLAFLLNDADLLNQAKRWVDALIASQRPDGFFGPTTNQDWWPRLVAAKALTTYYRATHERRILSFLIRFYDYMIAALPDHPLKFWAYARGMEAGESLDLVYRATHDEKYRLLALSIDASSFDWNHYFADFPYPHRTTRYLNGTVFRMLWPLFIALDEKAKKHPKPESPAQIIAANRSPILKTYLGTHGVNLAMALKYPVYTRYFNNESPRTSELWADFRSILEKHGTALDLFTSDEHLDGSDPRQGIELCTVAEAMYAMEEILRISRDPIAADYLEYYLYNAFPATVTPDYKAHQYCQQVNQTAILGKRNRFFNAGRDATYFGVAPHYGCCAANMHQAFPKALSGAVLHDDKAVYIYLYIPGHYTVRFSDGSLVSLDVSTRYPVTDQAIIKAALSAGSPKKLFFRAPWGVETEISLLGDHKTSEAGHRLIDAGTLFDEMTIDLAFRFAFKTIKNADGSYSLRRGPVLWALPIASETVSCGGTAPYHDRGFRPQQKVRIPSLRLVDGHLPIRRYRKGSADTYYEDDSQVTVFGYYPHRREPVALTLRPYGTTVLRVAQFPVRRELFHERKK